MVSTDPMIKIKHAILYLNRRVSCYGYQTKLIGYKIVWHPKDGASSQKEATGYINLWNGSIGGGSSIQTNKNTTVKLNYQRYQKRL